MSKDKSVSNNNYKIEELHDDHNTSKLTKYEMFVTGRKSFGALIIHELITTLISWIPGALGIFLRSRLYPIFLGNVGKNVIFGKGVDFRHPYKIQIGDNTVIDDNCLLDAKGSSNTGIKIGKHNFIGRNTILSCKNGDIELRDNVNIGFNCEIFSSSNVLLEDYTLLAAYCYIVGGGKYDLKDTGNPIAKQPIFDDRGIVIEKNCWLGARVTVLDGATIGHDTAIGAASLVSTNIPSSSIAVGIPASIIKTRECSRYKCSQPGSTSN